MSHSLRALTRLLPNWAGLPLWAALSAIVLWYTVKIWKSDAPLRLRLGVVDSRGGARQPSRHRLRRGAACAAVALVRRIHAGAAAPVTRRVIRPHVYWLFAALFIPTAAVIGIQASVPLMMGLLVWMTRVATQPAKA